MRLIGLEPTRRETPDPKSGAATNYATGADKPLLFIIAGAKIMIFFIVSNSLRLISFTFSKYIVALLRLNVLYCFYPKTNGESQNLKKSILRHTYKKKDTSPNSFHPDIETTCFAYTDKRSSTKI